MSGSIPLRQGRERKEGKTPPIQSQNQIVTMQAITVGTA